MKIIKFQGGLGNQMFQYAFYKAMAARFPDVKADLSRYTHFNYHQGFELDRIFDIQLPTVSAFMAKLYGKEKGKYRFCRKLLSIQEPFLEDVALFTYSEKHFKSPTSQLYDGYWQQYQYAERVKKELLADFTFRNLTEPENLETMARILADEVSVGIHVRRGDYALHPLLDGLADRAYFTNAINHFKKQYKTPSFYVFSDDIAWCKENLPLTEATFVDWNKGDQSYRDMQLMHLCKHTIISNSTFSWWAAWLNRYPDKTVIVPRIWYRSPYGVDTGAMHPPDWVRM